MINFRNPSSSATTTPGISYTRDVGPTATPPIVSALNNTESSTNANRISETPVKPIDTIIMVVAIALVTIIPEVVKSVVLVMA